MHQYLDTSGCLMEFLRRQLNDPGASRCGRCANCVRETFSSEMRPDLAEAGVNALRPQTLAIEPRKVAQRLFGDPSASESLRALRHHRTRFGKRESRVDGGDHLGGSGMVRGPLPGRWPQPKPVPLSRRPTRKTPREHRPKSSPSRGHRLVSRSGPKTGPPSESESLLSVTLVPIRGCPRFGNRKLDEAAPLPPIDQSIDFRELLVGASSVTP